MTQPLVLSLFPGADLFGMAFELENFCVVQGPDIQFGRDVRDFHPPAGRFDGVIGGPPCQSFSMLRTLQDAAGRAPRHGNLIPEYERIVAEARPDWFVMENVKAAPLPSVGGYTTRAVLFRDSHVGGATMRQRRLSFGTADGRSLPVMFAALHTPEPRGTVTSSDGGKSVRMERFTLSEMLHLQGLPADFFRESPLTIEGKRRVVGNGVPLPMGRAIARAVRAAMYAEPAEVSA